MSLNYDYFIDRAIRWAPTTAPRVLDYGCGTGTIVRMGAERGIDIVGVDSYDGFYANWHASVAEDVRHLVRRLDDEGQIPFEDGAFDVVISNQVFEHVRDPLPVLKEIRRVLKPRGVFIAAFPDNTVWFEGHVGLYFPHWLGQGTRLQTAYLKACYALGLGYYRYIGVDGWLHHINDLTFHHGNSEIMSWWCEAFDEKPRSAAADWMMFRIENSRLKRLLPIASFAPIRGFLEFVCRIRAGLVLVSGPARVGVFPRRPGYGE